MSHPNECEHGVSLTDFCPDCEKEIMGTDPPPARQTRCTVAGCYDFAELGTVLCVKHKTGSAI